MILYMLVNAGRIKETRDHTTEDIPAGQADHHMNAGYRKMGVLVQDLPQI